MQRYENFLIYANLPTTFLVKNTKYVRYMRIYP
nr:MAG TPA: hypothetical protein [Caudoviricetes sp.]